MQAVERPDPAPIEAEGVVTRLGALVAEAAAEAAPAQTREGAPTEPLLPRAVRPFNYHWAAAPFPTDVPGLEDVTTADCDVMVIPRGAAHPREAFEFIAFVQRQAVMERL